MQEPREVAGLQRKLAKAGVERRLVAEGVQRGDEVSIGPMTFEFFPDEDLDRPDGDMEGGTSGGDQA
jgi:hypothetical protein